MSYRGSPYCCCQMFPILNGLYVMSAHCMFHGLYAICLVITSVYKHSHSVINFCAVSSSITFILVGLLIFWTALYNSWKMSRICGCLVSITTVFSLTTYTLYFIEYIDFDANSVLDYCLFWRDYDDWIQPGDMPFTFWHVFTFFLIAITLAGWYYSFILCKCTHYLKAAAFSVQEKYSNTEL